MSFFIRKKLKLVEAEEKEKRRLDRIEASKRQRVELIRKREEDRRSAVEKRRMVLQKENQVGSIMSSLNT